MAAPTPDQLKQILFETLSPDSNVRRTAEKHLDEALKTAGHPLQVLQIVANATVAEQPIQQAAAVHFKNVVKKGWDANNDENPGFVISPQDRNTIKSHLVQLMCTVPPRIQAQVSEAISLIAQVDYPAQWDNLLPELVQQFRSTDPAVVNGVLKTANSIFKSFRYVGRSDELYKVILYTLDRVQAPLLTLFVEMGKAVDAFANDPAQLSVRLEALQIMCRIFYSLNYQDLPEFFEDHMQDWMGQFAKYLSYKNPCVTNEDEEDEPSPIDNLQAAVVANLALYADKDEEPFLPFLPEFTKLVWGLLMNVTSFKKHDTLATTSIKFLSSLVSKLMHKNLFQEEATLQEIVVKIVIPNLMFRESDEELFEDDPREYIVTEIEGSDSESRRRCSQDLLRAMCRQFEPQTTKICSEHIGVMLANFHKDPNKWASKDAAIHLLLGISIRRESSLGVSETNDAVDVMEFFNTHILQELQDCNHTARPVVKATALKFVTTFRNQFTRDQLVALMPMLISQLSSPMVPVHTIAALSIERILVTKQDLQGTSKQTKVTNSDLKPFLEPLFTSLFALVDNVNLNENDYVMKCVMRALAVSQEDVVPITEILIDKLTAALARVSKNPRNPQFNHYLFESVAVLVRSVCSRNASATLALENLLFPPFQTVLQMEILELSPYVFQILAQLLEYRSTETGLGQYEGLFRPLLTPTLWERKGDIPALTRLVQAYLMKSAAHLVSAGNLQGILGCFQKLLSAPSTEVDAFNLLNALVMHVPLEAMKQYNKTVFHLLLTKLQTTKSSRSEHRYQKLSKLIAHFFALFVAKCGANEYFTELASIQQGVAVSLVGQVWLPKLQTDPPQGLDAKIQLVGLTKLLCEFPALLDDPAGQQLWCAVFLAQTRLLSVPASVTNADDVDNQLAIDVQYDSAYSGLAFAKKQPVDPFPEVADPIASFAMALQNFSSQQPGRVLPLVQEVVKNDVKIAQAFDSLVQKTGLRLS